MSADFGDKMHPLGVEVPCGDLPARLNDPFDYSPHPLCRIAAQRLLDYIDTRPEWLGELNRGKMFGVAIVRTPDGRTGFTAAFSGNLAGSNRHDYFVPPVYDMLAPDGFFRRGEAEISEINRRIAILDAAPELAAARKALAEADNDARRRLDDAKRRMSAAKELRDVRRASAGTATELEAIDDESRREKSAFRRLKEECRRSVALARAEVERLEGAVAELKSERRRRSEALQSELFRHFEVVDARGARRNLSEIFADTPQGVPPAGAGECAAPKLFQHAFLNSLEVLSTAEFWFGESPRGEVRRHGNFYPACRGKCKPILDFMLRATEVGRRDAERQTFEPEVIFEDGRIAVIDKPAGMLSVEGRTGAQSVESWARQRFSESAAVVHRLDMATSGLLLIAKDAAAHRELQSQFARRTVRKRYIALLDGTPAAAEGCIDLPLRPDPDDRPRQVVDRRHGRRAQTRYRVIEVRDGRSLVAFEPVTGRTHQLRVHAACADGLNIPIAGDTLYGTDSASRLCLHNAMLEFTHPGTGERLRFESAAPDFFNL